MLSGTQGSRRVGSWPSPCEEEENGKSKGRIRELKRTVKREVSRKLFEPWILFFSKLWVTTMEITLEVVDSAPKNGCKCDRGL